MIVEDSLTVREADPADFAALTTSLARAFADDPVARWAAPRPKNRSRALRGFFNAYLKHKQPQGFVSCASDCAGAAIWVPPGKPSMDAKELLDIIRPNVATMLAFRSPLLAWGALKTDRHHPRDPHFYLAAIGVDPAAQGRGLGSQLLKPVLGICDQDRVAAYLESSDPANVDFYARHGFRVVDEVRLPRGPIIHTMWRDPR